MKSERKDVHFKDVEIFVVCGSFTNVASVWYKSLRLNSRVLVRSVPVRSVTTGSVTWLFAFAIACLCLLLYKANAVVLNRKNRRIVQIL